MNPHPNIHAQDDRQPRQVIRQRSTSPLGIAIALLVAMVASIAVLAAPTGVPGFGARPAAAVGSLGECGPSEITVGLYGGSVTVGLVAGNNFLDASPNYCVVLIPTSTWATMTVADFQAYDVLWIGNDSFDQLSHQASHFATAASTVGVWEQAIDPRKVMIAGGDYDWHYDRGQANAINVMHAIIQELSTGEDGPGLVLQAGNYSVVGQPWFQTLGGSFAGLGHGTVIGSDPSPADVNTSHPFNAANGFNSGTYFFGWSCHGAMRITPGSPVSSYNLQELFRVEGQPCFMLSDPNFPPDIVEIGLTQDLSSFEPQSDGSVDMEFSFLIENLSSVELSSVELSLELADVFAGATVSAPVPDNSSGNCSEAVLSGSQVLGVGESCTAQFSVTVTGLRPNTTYFHSASVSGVSPKDVVATDLSDDDVTENGVLDPTDSNGNGSAGDAGEDDPTPVLLGESPAIGLTKDFTSIVEISEGVSEVKFSYLIENLGDVDLSTVELEEDFGDTFSGQRFTGPVPDDDAGTCSTSAAAGSAVLAAGESCVAVWTVTVTTVVPGVLYQNTASVTGLSPSGATVSDISDDDDTEDGVLDPSDSNGNGRADDPGENDATPVLLLELQPSLILNQVWDDLDLDGIQDEDEPGIVGIPVNLYTYNPATGATELLEQTLTGGGGNCPAGESPCVGVSVFRNVKPGPDRFYVIEIEVPAGSALTAPGVGSDDEIDSDVSQTTARSEPFTVEEDSRYRVIDMGLVPEGSAPGTPWILGDVNCDGKANIVDALIIAQFSVGTRSAVKSCALMLGPPEHAVAYRGDMNLDGATNVVDSLLVARCSVGAGEINCDQMYEDCATGICEYRP